MFSATKVENMRSEGHFSPVSWMETDNTTRVQPDGQQSQLSCHQHRPQPPESDSDTSKIVVEVLASSASGAETLPPKDECPQQELSTSDLGMSTGQKRALPEVRREQTTLANRYQQHHHRSLNHRHSYPKYDRHMLSERSMSVDNDGKRHTLASKSVDMDCERLLEPHPYRRHATTAAYGGELTSVSESELNDLEDAISPLRLSQGSVDRTFKHACSPASEGHIAPIESLDRISKAGPPPASGSSLSEHNSAAHSRFALSPVAQPCSSTTHPSRQSFSALPSLASTIPLLPALRRQSAPNSSVSSFRNTSHHTSHHTPPLTSHHTSTTPVPSHSPSGMLGPGPGPAPTPALTLPPLRELDKVLGPEADHGRISNPQPRSQSSDPHLHQHFQQQRPQGHSQYAQHSPSLASSQHGYKHHDPSSHFSSTGSLPDLYMSSPSAPPSTTTSSSLSRTDSISNMDYLQSNSTSRASSNATAGGTVPNASETETVNPQQQEPAPSSSTPAAAPNSNNTTTTTTTAVTTAGAGAKEGSAKTSAAAENQQQQGRNSTKRAAQNRAAQRAFRQRKDLYVRELERKADLLQQAESKIARLSARNRELEELVFQAQQYRQGISPSPMVSPLSHHQQHAHNQDSPITGGSLDRGDRERGRESDREWEREREREWALRERSHNHADSIGGPPYDHFNASSIPRPALGRHSSHQHLRQAYNASSPPISSDAFKHLSLNNKLSSHLHDQPRPESDHEIDMHSRPSRHLHRHPSESSLNLSRAASFGAPPAPIDSRTELASSSPAVINAGNTAMSAKGPGSLGALPPSGSHDLSSLHHYPSSPLTPTHERMPPYASNQNPRSVSGMGGPNGPMSSPTSEVSSYDLAKKRPSDGMIGWSGSNSGPGSELYRSSPDAHPHHPYLAHHAVKKQASWSSLSDQRRLQHSLKKQPSWGSISEYRHSWRTKSVESPEMVSENARFGGGGGGGAVPGLPRIPSQFSQRPPPPPTLHQQQHSNSGFEREYPSSPAASFTYSPTSAHSQPHPQHGRQPSDYFNTPRAPGPATAKHDRHESSDMEIVQDSNSSAGHYARQSQAVYDTDPYEMERDDRFVRKESIKSNMSVVGSSPERSYNMQSEAC